ncbi:MAG TPA: hypothetical protein VFN91_05620 [Myxococcaceae bacterium]|nr:hypothetical protein [Myxococcaceae bacterium]
MGGRRITLGILGALIALCAVVRLVAVLPQVTNRHALSYDAARRAMVDMDAADAIRRADVARFGWDVAGPEQWPTLRLLLAAPAHVLAGAGRALDVELGVSVTLVGFLVVALALSAAVLATSTTGAVGLFAVSTALLLGNRDLLEHGANGMLEVPEALLTLGATVAWIHARERGVTRPWSLALLGNALFHAKFQQGLFLAGTVVAVEMLGPGWTQRLGAVASALGRSLRTPWVLGILLLGLASTGVSVGMVWAGGAHGIVLGQVVNVGRPRVVHWCMAVTLLGPLLLGFASERTALRAALPPLLRFAWAWLLCPMLLWLLVPFTWRLETLIASAGFDAGVGTLAPLDRLLFYPRAAWGGWFSPGGGWVALALLACTGVAALRSRRLRAQLVPIAAVVGVEVLLLTFLGGRNLQPRFSVNLAPLVALAAALWTDAAPPAWTAVTATVATTVLLVLGRPTWRDEALISTLSRGFESRQNGDACREVARALPLADGELVNETHPSRLQTCNFWVKALARERGAQVRVREPWIGPEPHTVLLLTDGTQPEGPRNGWTALGPRARQGMVDGALYRVEPGAWAGRR